MDGILLQRNVARNGYWCDVYQVGWKVREFHCPETGQRETLIYPRKVNVHLGDIDDPALVAGPDDLQAGTVMDEERLADRRRLDAMRKKALAKTKCRHAIKSHDLRQLLTGTYRENMLDFDRVRADFARYQRLMRRYVPGWRCVVAFERQKRGAWHWHAAVDRMPVQFMHEGRPVRSFDFVRRMWERIVGSKKGTVNVDGHQRGKKQHADARTRSLARVAGYVSKYLTKALGEALDESIEGRNMWGRTQGLQGTKPVTFEISENISFAEMVHLVFQRPEGHRIARHWCSPDGRTWLLYTEPE